MSERKKRTVELKDEVKRAVKKDVKKEEPIEGRTVSTGSTLLDLAITDFLGGYVLGTVVHIIGGDASSKSLLALSLMAEACNNKNLDDYSLVYAEPESAMNFDLKKMFGKKMEKRVEFTPTPEERKVKPMTVQDWHNDLSEKVKKPYIYVTDSFDALSSEDDLKQKEAPTKGGYHTEKALVASSTFPKVVGQIEATKSLLLWISQTRANLGPGFESETFTGGNAIKFYRSIEMWPKKTTKIFHDIRGGKLEVGRWIRVEVRKNKHTGKIRTIAFPVYYDYGIDDIGSMIQWLIDNKFWKMAGAYVDCNGDFGSIEKEDGSISTIKMYKDDLIKAIEDNDQEQKLKEIVFEAWKQKEAEAELGRKPKYG